MHRIDVSRDILNLKELGLGVRLARFAVKNSGDRVRKDCIFDLAAFALRLFFSFFNL